MPATIDRIRKHRGVASKRPQRTCTPILSWTCAYTSDVFGRTRAASNKKELLLATVGYQETSISELADASDAREGVVVHGGRRLQLRDVLRIGALGTEDCPTRSNRNAGTRRTTQSQRTSECSDASIVHLT